MMCSNKKSMEYKSGHNQISIRSHDNNSENTDDENNTVW